MICLGLVLAGKQHHAKQIKKLLDYTNEQQIKNPLSRMWFLIIVNVFCQIVQLIESLVFLLQTDLSCKFAEVLYIFYTKIKDTNVDRIIKLIFSLFSLHLSFACTIIVFELRRRGE